MRALHDMKRQEIQCCKSKFEQLQDALDDYFLRLKLDAGKATN